MAFLVQYPREIAAQSAAAGKARRAVRSWLLRHNKTGRCTLKSDIARDAIQGQSVARRCWTPDHWKRVAIFEAGSIDYNFRFVNRATAKLLLTIGISCRISNKQFANTPIISG
jgi:hypothetical protein